VQNLHFENYKSVERNLKVVSKWKHIPCSCMGKLNIVKMVIILKGICKFNIFMYENSRMRLAEGILRRGEGDKGE
jgi:hypothetical protein